MSESQKVKFPCSSCGREFTWKPEIAGKRAKCKCGAVLVVPKTRPVIEDEPAPLEDDDAFGLAGEDDAEVAPPPPPPLPPTVKSGKTAVAGRAGAALAGSALSEKLNIGGGGDDGDTWKWWYYVVGGLAMIPVAIYQYMRLMDYESGESSRTGLKSFERMLYGMFGKWGVVAFIILIGAVCVTIGLYKYKKQREAA
jgi:hypothetical protein